MRFERTNIDGCAAGGVCISGFSFSLGVAYTDDADSMARCLVARQSVLHRLAAAAVEMWRGTRMLVWRQLLQRHVLLHKVPVVDQPSVIPADQALDSLFDSFSDCLSDNAAGQQPDIAGIAGAIADRRAAIDMLIGEGSVMSAACRLMTLAMTVAAHFAKDGLYNFIGNEFNPDRTLTQIHESVLAALTSDGVPAASRRHVADYMKKAMAELRETDAWTYFRFPTFLRHIP